MALWAILMGYADNVAVGMRGDKPLGKGGMGIPCLGDTEEIVTCHVLEECVVSQGKRRGGRVEEK